LARAGLHRSAYAVFRLANSHATFHQIVMTALAGDDHKDNLFRGSIDLRFACDDVRHK
jgi:hypothetical protein